MISNDLSKCTLNVATLILVIVDVAQSRKTPLFQGKLITEFFVSCTPAARDLCLISSPEDFKKLKHIKQHIDFQLHFSISPIRIIISSIIILVVFALSIHLVIARRFDCKSLPFIRRFYPEIQEETDRKNGFLYHQYVWMSYSVLQGHHPKLTRKPFRDVNWIHYHNRESSFNYRDVKIERFKFLDNRNLTKHLIMEIEKEEHDLAEHHLQANEGDVTTNFDN